MGTLFDQVPRREKDAVVAEDKVSYLLEMAVELSEKFDVTVSDVIAAYSALQGARYTDFCVNNGDTHDEQMAGIGMILQDISGHLKDIANS